MATRAAIVRRRTVECVSELTEGELQLENGQWGFATADQAIVIRDLGGKFYTISTESIVNELASLKSINPIVNARTSSDDKNLVFEKLSSEIRFIPKYAENSNEAAQLNASAITAEAELNVVPARGKTVTRSLHSMAVAGIGKEVHGELITSRRNSGGFGNLISQILHVSHLQGNAANQLWTRSAYSANNDDAFAWSGWEKSAGNMALAATANTDDDARTPAVASSPIGTILQTIWDKIRSVANRMASYLPLAGGTMDQGATIHWPNQTTGVRNLITATVGDNDDIAIRAGSDGTNAGYLELATFDDGNEPIYVKQNNNNNGTSKRTALMDENGFMQLASYLRLGNGMEDTTPIGGVMFDDNGLSGYVRRVSFDVFRRKLLSGLPFGANSPAGDFNANDQTPSDLNDNFYLLNTGMWWALATANAPYEGWIGLINIRYRFGAQDGNLYGDQIAVGTLTSCNAGRMWTRSQNNGAWTAWVEKANKSDIPDVSAIPSRGILNNDAEIITAYNNLGADKIGTYRIEAADTASSQFAGIKARGAIYGIVSIKARGAPHTDGFFAEIELWLRDFNYYNRPRKFFRSWFNGVWTDQYWIEVPQGALVVDEAVDLNTMYLKYTNGTFLITGESGNITNSPVERWFIVEQSVFTRGNTVRILQKFYKDNDVSRAWTRIGTGTWNGFIFWQEALTGGANDSYAVHRPDNNETGNQYAEGRRFYRFESSTNSATNKAYVGLYDAHGSGSIEKWLHTGSTITISGHIVNNPTGTLTVNQDYTSPTLFNYSHVENLMGLRNGGTIEYWPKKVTPFLNDKGIVTGITFSSISICHTMIHVGGGYFARSCN